MVRKLLPHVTVIIGLLILLSLGTWQVSRLQWKNELQQEMSERFAAEAVPLSSLDHQDPVAPYYQRVSVKGAFLHDKEVHVYMVSPKDGSSQAGYQILTPLKKSDGSFVLIDRGWVPEELKDASRRVFSLPDGIVTIEGVILPGEKRGAFTPDNDFEQKIWYWIHIPEIADALEIDLSSFFIRDFGYKGDDIFLKKEYQPELHNDHLQYVITWYSLALILLVIYILFQIQRKHKVKKP